MKVKELIKKLGEFNPDAEVRVIDKGYTGHSIMYYGYGSSEGCTEKNCEDVAFIFAEVNNSTERYGTKEKR